METFQHFIASLFAMRARNLALRTVLGKLRVVTRTPIGGGKNHKTGRLLCAYGCAPDECPLHCPFRVRGCYAQTGHVHFASERARGVEPVEHAWTVAALAAVSALWCGSRPVRDLVSGDLGATVADAQSYLNQVCSALRWTQETIDGHTPAIERGLYQACAYAYTAHFRESLDLPLQGGRYHLNFSHQIVDSGVVVWPHDQLDALRSKIGRRVVPCPAQTKGKTCAECLICAGARPFLVAFEPHGTYKAIALKAGIDAVIRYIYSDTRHTEVSC